jgi:hypothetical protein
MKFSLVAQSERPKAPIITDDFCKWIKTYDGPGFNFIHCDFPYGIDTDERKQGNAPDVLGSYDDSEETYWTLLKALCDNRDRICTDSAHIMFWFSMKYYTDTIAFFKEHSDFKIDPFPLVWMKSDKVGLLPDPNRGPRRIYETCLFGSRGDRKVVETGVVNACHEPTVRSQHMSTKPVPVLRHFFRMFIDENSTVLDPTCGSGTALRAAKSLGAEYVLGVEKDEVFAKQATRAFEDWVLANGNEADPPTPPPPTPA